MDSTSGPRIEATREAIAPVATNATLKACRHELARFSSTQMFEAATELLLLDRVVNSDVPTHGHDERVAVSVLLRIAGELVSASADLFADGRHYAAAALLRQIVEIEYLAWAFENRHGDAERWLRSTKQEREEFFRPAKLRAAAQGRFRGKDYSYHCELGGHPVPQADTLLIGDAVAAQLLLSDLLCHVGNIWDHTVGWARQNCVGTLLLELGGLMPARFRYWKDQDPLVDLPPPP